MLVSHLNFPPLIVCFVFFEHLSTPTTRETVLLYYFVHLSDE